MAIQPTPPIQLDPSMDKGHELAFINQNFNNIASVLSQNSLLILLSDTTSTVLSFGGNQSTTLTIPHNLGYIPAVLVYGTISTNILTIGAGTVTPTYGGNFVQTPFNLFYLTGGNYQLLSCMYTESDTTNLYIKTQQNFFNGATSYTYNYYYYILSKSVHT